MSSSYDGAVVFVTTDVTATDVVVVAIGLALGLYFGACGIKIIHAIRDYLLGVPMLAFGVVAPAIVVWSVWPHGYLRWM